MRLKLLRGTGLAGVLLSAIAVLVSPSAYGGDFDFPAPPLPLEKALTLWATHYYVHAAMAAPGGIPLRDKKNKPISAPITLRDWCLGAIEGTVTVTDDAGQSTTFNYHDAKGSSQVDCRAVLGINKPWIDATGRSRFGLSAGPFGEGVRDFLLVPYRTVAVDPKIIAFGTVIYVPAARGRTVTLPDGTSVPHDGYFFAGDTGGAIKQNHIDVFSGTFEGNPFPGLVRSSPEHTFDAYLVSDPVIIAALTQRHQRKDRSP